MTLLVVLLASSTLLLLAVFMSFVLGWANKAFYVEVDPVSSRSTSSYQAPTVPVVDISDAPTMPRVW